MPSSTSGPKKTTVSIALLAVLITGVGDLGGSSAILDECDPAHDKTCAVPLPGEAVVAYFLDELAVLPWEGNATIQEDREVGNDNAKASVNASAKASWNLGGPEKTEDPGSSDHVLLACGDPQGCPDLIVDRPDLVKDLRIRTEFFGPNNCNVAEGSTEPGFRRVMRFTFTAANDGDGHLLVGSPGSWSDLFEWGECHGHWHFKSFAEYRLWTPEGYQEWKDARSDDPDALPDEILAERPWLDEHLITSRKQGFCMIDIKRHDPFAGPRQFVHCSHQGITKGWADSYVSSLDGQFVDITGVSSDWYVLEVESNPARLIEEQVYTNNTETLALFVPPDPNE